jgi:hypothetical protein
VVADVGAAAAGAAAGLRAGGDRVIGARKEIERAPVRSAEPHRRLMAAVLQTVIDDCRGTVYRNAMRYPNPTSGEGLGQAVAYVTSTDRSWPFSFENLCDALGMDADTFRRALRNGVESARVESVVGEQAMQSTM